MVQLRHGKAAGVLKGVDSVEILVPVLLRAQVYHTPSPQAATRRTRERTSGLKEPKHKELKSKLESRREVSSFVHSIRYPSYKSRPRSLTILFCLTC